jgi:hypothetical protein
MWILLFGLALLLTSVPTQAAPVSEQGSTNAPTMRNLSVAGSYENNADAVVVRGNIAYAGFGYQLAILDVTNPARPMRLGHVMLPNRVDTLVVDGGYAYIYNTWLSIVDISKPSAPVLVSHIGAGDTPQLVSHGLAKRGDYLLAVSGICTPRTGCSGSMDIIDVHNPAAPATVQNYCLPGQPNAITVSGNIAYIAVGSSLDLEDVTNPAAPLHLNALDLGGIPYDIAVAGSYTYMVVRPLNSSSTSVLEIIDIANPTAPSVVKILPFPNTELYSVALEGQTAFVGSWADVRAVDVSNPAAPVVRGRYTPPPEQGSSGLLHMLRIAASPTTLFVATQQLWLVDRRDPARLTAKGSFGAPYAASRAAPWAGYVYSAGFEGINVFDVTAGEPALVGSAKYSQASFGSEAVGAAAWNQHLYVALPSQLVIFTLEDPRRPREVAHYMLQSYVLEAFAASDQKVYLGVPGELQILDTSQPAAPSMIGRLPLLDMFGNPTDVRALDLWDTHVLLGTASGELLIADATDPRAPKLVSHTDIPGASDVKVCRGYACVAVAGDLQIYDLSNLSAPRKVGAYSGSVGIDWIAAAEGYLFVGGPGKLEVLDFSDPPNVYKAGESPYAEPVTRWNDDLVSGGLLIQHFTPPRRLSGYVSSADGAPAAGVTITANDGTSARTDTNGFYIFADLPAATYTITPNLAGARFVPATRSVALTANLQRQNFAWLPAPVSVGIMPGAAATLGYTDTHGLRTELAIPAGAFASATTLTLTSTFDQPGGGLAGAGHAFVLSATPGVPAAFGQPLTLTLRYSAADVRSIIDPSKLAVRWWDGAGWRAPDCPGPFAHDMQQRQITMPICRAGAYQLVGPSNQRFLPLAGL